MTIDEAIEKYRKITSTDANCQAYCDISCDKCTRESRQLSEWLEDYKRIKMLIPIEQALKNEYSNAIDECIEIVKFHSCECDGIELAIRDLEELKARYLGGDHVGRIDKIL